MASQPPASPPGPHAASSRDFGRIRVALTKGENSDRLLDGRDFSRRYWINVRAALSRIERQLETAQNDRDALKAVIDDGE